MSLNQLDTNECKCITHGADCLKKSVWCCHVHIGGSEWKIGFVFHGQQEETLGLQSGQKRRHF